MKHYLRMLAFGLLAVGALVAIHFLAPAQLPVALWKVALLCVAAFLGYWVDRCLFPYARPHAIDGMSQPSVLAAAMLRRAIVVAAVIVGVALAL